MAIKIKKKDNALQSFDGARFISEKFYLVMVSAILLVALMLRILALLSLKKSLYFDYLLLDEKIYHTWAVQIANGTYRSLSVYEFSPLPAYVWAFIYQLFTPDIFYIRILNIILGVAACYFIYRIGTEMAGRRVGLASCLVAALYQPFIFYSVVPLKTALSVVMFALGTWLVLALLRKHSNIKLLLLGLVAGLMLNARGNFIVMMPLMLGTIFYNGYQRDVSLKKIAAGSVIFVCGLLSATAPFAIRNYRISGDFVLTTSQSGFNLYLGNNLINPAPVYRPLAFASTSPFKQGIHFTIEASRRAGKKLSPQQASSYWTREILKLALDEPVAFAKKMFLKTLVLFNRFENGDHYCIDFISQFVRFFRLPLLTFGWLLPFGMAGMITAGFKTPRLSFVSLAFILYASTLVIFFTNARYRLPLAVAFIPFAVLGIGNLWHHFAARQFKTAGVHLAAVLLFFLIEYLPLEAVRDVTAHHNIRGIILNSKGFKDQAVSTWQKSSRLNGSYSAFANLSLADRCIEKRDFHKAIGYLDKISDHSFAAAYKYNRLGDIMQMTGKKQSALGAYKKALEINSAMVPTRKKLIRLLQRIDHRQASKEKEALRYILSFYKGR